MSHGGRGGALRCPAIEGGRVSDGEGGGVCDGGGTNEWCVWCGASDWSKLCLLG